MNRFKRKSNGETQSPHYNFRNSIPEKSEVLATLPGSHPPPPYRPEYAERVAQMAKHGATRSEIMEMLGISSNVLILWSTIFPEFSAALQANDEMRTRRVEDSLYQRACGFKYEEEYYPPDVAAARIWLEQKDPENWRPVRDVNVNASVRVAAITASMTLQEAQEAYMAVVKGAAIEGNEDDSNSL